MTNSKYKKEIVNLANAPLKLDFDHRSLKKYVILPDYNPGSGLDVGTVAVFDRQTHKINPDFLGHDIGCGMLLARISKPDYKLQEEMAQMKEEFDKKQKRSIIGGGNHFLNIYQVASSGDPAFTENDFFVLLHTGAKEKKSSSLKNESNKNLLEYAHQKEKEAKMQRRETMKELGFGELETILNKSHNTIKASDKEVVYRKGAIKLLPGELAVIPSHYRGEAVLAYGKDKIAELEYSMCHGTGRNVSRADFKEGSENDLVEIYRELSEIKEKIEPYVSIKTKLMPLTNSFVSLNKIKDEITKDIESLDDASLDREYERATSGAKKYVFSTENEGENIIETGEDVDGAVHFLAYASAIKTLDYLQENVLRQNELDRDSISLYSEAFKRKKIIEESSYRYNNL